MEDAKLPLDPPVIAGETIQMRNDGLTGKRGAGALSSCKIFQAIEPIEAEVLNGDAVHEQSFVIGDGLVLAIEGLTKVLERAALAGLQVDEKEFIGGAQAVLEGIHARALFAVGRFGHDIKLVEFRLQVMFNKGHKSRSNVVDAVQMYD